MSSGKKVLIDGQQRITALQASLLGVKVLDSSYKKKSISISFNPIEEKFEVTNSAISKNSLWIANISTIFDTDFSSFGFVMEYCQKNNIEDMESVNKVINKLIAIRNINFGVIELSDQLDIERVTEIFIRINSKGVVLSQADFAMSKISSTKLLVGTPFER